MGTRFTDGAGNRLWEDYATGGATGNGSYAVGDEIMRLDVAGCGSRIILRPVNDFAVAGATATAQWSLDGVEWDPVPYFDLTTQSVTATGVFALGSGHPLIFPDIGNYFRIIANTAGKFANPALPNLVAGYTEDDGYQFAAAASGGGGSSGGPATIANGADVAEGSTTDPASASGANTTVIGALRAIRDRILGTLSISGVVGSADGALITIGTTTDAATASGANTTAIGALRAIRDKLLGSIAVTGTFFQATQPVSIANGSNVAEGTLTDAAATSASTTGSIIAWLRGLLTLGGSTSDTAYGGTGSSTLSAALRGIYAVCAGPTPAGTNTIGYLYRALNFTESNTPLAASASFTGSIRNTNIANGSPTPYSYINVTAFADQAGTLFVENTTDGVFWYPLNGTAGTAMAAGTSLVQKYPATINAYRVRFTNGSTAQTKFLLLSGFSTS